MVYVDGTGIDGGGDDGRVIILVGGVIRGVDVEGIRLCHCRGDGWVVGTREIGATMGEGAGMDMGGVV